MTCVNESITQRPRERCTLKSNYIQVTIMQVLTLYINILFSTIKARMVVSLRLIHHSLWMLTQALDIGFSNKQTQINQSHKKHMFPYTLWFNI